jgi:hypothetical protein
MITTLLICFTIYKWLQYVSSLSSLLYLHILIAFAKSLTPSAGTLLNISMLDDCCFGPCRLSMYTFVVDHCSLTVVCIFIVMDTCFNKPLHNNGCVCTNSLWLHTSGCAVTMCFSLCGLINLCPKLPPRRWRMDHYGDGVGFIQCGFSLGPNVENCVYLHGHWHENSLHPWTWSTGQRCFALAAHTIALSDLWHHTALPV